MASEIYGDLDSIHDEDMLRRMWQQSEDFGIKKEIRTHMYKLREERLRNFYTTGEMDSTGFPPTKSPLTPSHGDSLADQSFQSFKTKEIRDSESPSRDFQLSRGGVLVPDTSGWNIVTSSEISPDGRARKTESIATTEGIQKLPGGRSEFTGKNEHLTKISHQGDDRNFVKSSAETSATQFHEKSVTGDANSGRMETKSSTTTSSSRVTSSKFSSTDGGEGVAIPDHEQANNEFGLDSTRFSTIREKQQTIDDRNQDTQYNQRIHNERFTNNNTSNVQTTTTNHNESHVTNKNLEKQNIQKEVDLLAAQPGVVISRSVDYPDPNTKVITETKQLADGTTVTTRKYETKSASSKTFRSSSNQQHSTVSRNVVEDRSQRNRVEYITSDDTESFRHPQPPAVPNEQTRTIRDNQSNNTVNQKTRSENVITEHTTSRKSSVQNVDTTDRTTRRENLKDQVENIHMDDTVRRTVKKDLSQQYRNQDFLDSERDYQPHVDRSPGHVGPSSPPHHSSVTRTERIISSREIETDRVITDSTPSTPAAGKPSYNARRSSPPLQSSPTHDKPHGRPGERQIPVERSEYPNDMRPDNFVKKPSETPTAPAGKPSYNIQPTAGKPSYTKSVHDTDTRNTTHQYREVRETQVDDNQIKVKRDSRYPSEEPETLRRQPVQPDQRDQEIVTTTTIMRSYEPSPRERDTPRDKEYPVKPGDRYPTDHSVRTHDHRETSKTSTTKRSTHTQEYPRDKPESEHIPKPVRPGEHNIPISRNDKRDAPSPNAARPVSPNREISTTTTTVTRTYTPSDKEFEPDHLRKSPQKEYPNERQIPISYKPGDNEPSYPAGKPSYGQPGTQKYSAPDDRVPRRSNERNIPVERTDQPIRKEPEHPAGKPSYTAPRRPESVTRDSPRQPKSYPEEFDEPHRGIPREKYVRRPSEESYVSTDTTHTNATYTTKKISKEVDAAHEAFARSLRCVSPTTDRGSVRSLRTSTTSIRSSLSPEKTSPRNKKTQRSTSRDSIPQSESSRISTSTVTKGKPSPQKDAYRTPRKPSDTGVPTRTITTTTTTTIKTKEHPHTSRPTSGPRTHDQPSKSRPTPRHDIHKSNETVDLTTTRKDSNRQIRTTKTKEIDEYPGEIKKSPSPSSVPLRPKNNLTPNKKKSISSLVQTTMKSSIIKTGPTSEPKTSRYPQKNGSSPTTINKPRPPKETQTQVSKTTIDSNKQTATTNQSVTSKTCKEVKRSPQHIDIKTPSDAPKASRSPYSSPERSTRPVQPKRNSPETTVSPSRLSSKPAAGLPSKATVNKRFTETINVNNSITVKNNKTPKSQKPVSDTRPRGSDDEGFEVESPRSSSPTSSVSDLVYHKAPAEEPNRGTRRPTRPDEFIDRERDDIKVNTSKRTTTVVDESTYERQLRTKTPSPERRYPRPDQEHPSGPSESEPEYYPGDTGSHQQYPENVYPCREDYPRQSTDSPSQITHVTDQHYPDDEDKPREPFYLIRPQPDEDERSKRPNDSDEPKPRPPLKRSETYEERCRKILGMDRNDTTKLVRDDFISHERTTDERNRIPGKSRPNDGMHVPSKRRPERTTYSPDRSDEPFIEETTTTTVKKTSKLIHPRSEAPHKSPSPTRTKPQRSDETSPTREQIERIRENSPIRKSQSRSPEPSPSRHTPANERRYPEKQSLVSPDRKSDIPTYQRPGTKNEPQDSSRDHITRRPGQSPNRTVTRVDKVFTTSKPSSKQPKSTSPQRRSPTRGSPGSGYDRTNKCISPERSPVRKAPENNDRKYRPAMSPTRESVQPTTGTRKPSDRSPSRSPVRGFSPSKYTETVTVVTQKTTKDTGPSPKTTPKTNDTPTRPKHITTAKIQISPPTERKPTDTNRSDKPTTARKTKSVTTENTIVPKTANKPKKSTYDEDDSEPPTETEDVTTVIETTTIIKQIPDKKQPGKGKYPLTDRKDSAPVFRTTKTTEKEKMTRSTSENVIKNIPRRQNPDIVYTTSTDQPRRKSLDKKRPVKCLATKTINLTTTDNIMNSEEMEDVIIDIQQAKSSREASPNRMVPLPVRHDEDTGTPRYPDKVQEPDDETRRRPKVKDIPIYEEGTNEYTRCHVSEVEDSEDTTIRKTTSRYPREEEETDESVTYITRVVRDRDTSDDYLEPRPSESPEPDDYRLSVHDKVAKFITTAEEVKKPKSSAPFQREPHTDDTEPDDCLLSVNDKVSKFLTTAENITKPIKPGSTSQPQHSRVVPDDELLDDECILSVSEKVNKFTTSADHITEDIPQKSPRLVSKIERQISRKGEPEITDEEDQPPSQPADRRQPLKPTGKDRHPTNRSEPVDQPRKSPIRNTERVKTVKSVFESEDSSKPKQRDILSRPSVWEEKRTTTEVKLQDIGVHRPFDDETERIIKRERSRSQSPGEPQVYEPVPSTKPKVTKSTHISKDTVTSKRNIFENHTTKTTKQTDVIKSQTRRQPSDVNEPIRKPMREGVSKVQPKDSSPTRPSKKTPITRNRPDDGGYIETETTTVTRRFESKSPTRQCEYYPTERKSPSPVRHTAAKPRDTITDSRRKPDTSPSRLRPSDSPTRKTSKPVAEIPTKPSIESPRYSQPRKPSDTSSGRAPLQVNAEPYTSSPFKKAGHVPSYMEPTVSSLEHRRDSSEIIRHIHQDSDTSHETSDVDAGPPVSNVPSYMEHTISSIEHRRESLDINKTHSKRTSHDSLQNIETVPKSTKFGVELKRTDTRDSVNRRKSSSGDMPDIEEIFDLEILEKLLETVVGYEQRRRIRSQIRIVKKIIEEGTIQKKGTTTTITRTVTRKSSETSPVRKTETIVTRRTGSSPERRLLTNAPQAKRPSTDAKSDSKKFIQTESRHVTRHEEKSTVRERSLSPQGKIRTVTTTTTEFRKNGERPVKKTIVQTEEKPVWATKNILKKPSENIRTTVKKTTPTPKPQRQIVRKDEADSITSSYGIGPTDDDGRPLFGIRALKKKSQQQGDTTKVTGSVVTETYYSKNGAPPVGERKIIVYSNDPDDVRSCDDLGDNSQRGVVSREQTSRDGITSITRIQKIGKPMESEFTDVPAVAGETSTVTTTKQSKVVRRGSVKEMSEKFTKKGSVISDTEKISNTAYPKAGLILRSQNYSSTENVDPSEECHVEIRTTRKQSRTQMQTETDSETEQRRVSKTTKSFLNSHGEKVRGIDDVLDRMRNSDDVIEDGESTEDQEARSLLNKFLGASVLMSGVESMVPKEVITRTVVESPGKHEIKTHVTKTVRSGSSSVPVDPKTCDIEEIWDEQYLKQLLEQTSNYEERRRIRARIRQIMAEKEACADISTSVKAEIQSEQHNKTVVKSEKEESEQVSASETESEYEEIEIVEEVTDDSSAEVQEGEEEDEEGGEEEETEEEEGEDAKEAEPKDSASNGDETAPKDTPKPSTSEVDSKAVKKTSTVEETKTAEVKTEHSNLEAKEQSICTTETTKKEEKDGAVVTTTTKVTTRTIASAPKPVSPFAKFRQLDKQNSQNSPITPSSPMTPGGTSKGAPLFQFTDPALCARAATVKEQLLQWCQMKTKEYENVQITNFSTSWSDGLAFCALIHHFLPDAFDYSKLSPKERRHNFELAFRVADEKAGIAPLLDVEDMVVMRKPDWKCVFTYVQTIFRRFRNSV